MAEATDLFLALGAVVKRLRHNPLPGGDDRHSALRQFNPAPRHVAAMVQVALDGPLTISELAERLRVSLATTSQVVSDIEEWDLVTKTTDPADRRRTLVAITDTHRPLIRAMIEQRLKPLQRTLQRLEPDQRAAFVQGLAILADELDHAKETAR
jgi:DNA-binding MarR family transcriptional regulator